MGGSFLSTGYFQNLLGLLAVVMLLSLILERALAVPFEWTPIEGRLTRFRLRAPIAFLVSWWIVGYAKFDLIAAMFSREWSDAFSAGAIITAGLIAGGSKGAMVLFQGVLGFGKEAVAARVAAATQNAQSTAPAATSSSSGGGQSAAPFWRP